MIYEYSYSDLYSNNQNCRKINIDTDVETKIRKGEYILDKGNELYVIQNSSDNKIKIEDYSYLPSWKKIIINALNNDDVKKLISIQNNYTKNEIYALVLKNDNNLYKQTYKDNSNTSFEKEEVYKSLERYGNIRHIQLSNYFKGYSLEENTITEIISDKGYYYMGEIETDECKKYADIECKLELKESEIYKKFSKDIKYVEKYYIK